MVERIARQMRIVFYTAWPQQRGHAGVVQDISPMGMQFVTEISPRKDMHIKVECPTCSAVASVTNFEKRPFLAGMAWVVGVEFVTILFRETRGSFVSLKI